MAQTLTYGVIVPNADGKEQISATGVDEMRTLGASADAQLGNRATYADLSDAEGRLQGGIGATNDRITAANDWIAKLRLYIQENGAIRGAGIVDLRQDSPGQMTIVWMDPDTSDVTEEVIDLPAGFGNFVEVAPGVWELHTEESTIGAGQIVGLDDLLQQALAGAGRGTSVTDHGAVGDGVADDTAAFAAAFASGIPVYVPGGTYRVSGAWAGQPVDMTLAADAVIQHDAAGPGLLIEGTEGAEVAVTADVATGALDIPAPGHGLVEGDFLRLGSDLLWDASSTKVRHGEILRVAGVDGDTVSVTTPVQGGPYRVAEGAVITRLSMVDGVRITGGTIRGMRQPNLAQTGVLTRLARNVTIEGVRFEDIDYRHIAPEDCLDVHLVRNAHDWAQDKGMAYGVAVTGASQDVEIQSCRFVDVRHAVTTSNLMAVRGVTRRLLVADCVLRRSLPALNETSSGGDGFDTHTAADWVTYDRNLVEASSGGGINVECRNSRVRWNMIIAPAGTGISVHNESDLDGSTEIVGNTVIAGPNTIYGIRVSPAGRGAGTTMRGVIVSQNTIKGIASTPIYMGSAANAPLYAVSVVGNTFIDCPGAYMVRQVNGYGVIESGNVTDKGQYKSRTEDIAPKGDDAGFEYGTFNGEAIAVTPTGKYIQLTGNTGDTALRNITGAARGQFITLIAPLNGARVTIGGTGNIYPATPLSIAGRETVTLSWNGFVWAETARSLATTIAYDTDGVPYLAGV